MNFGVRGEVKGDYGGRTGGNRLLTNVDLFDPLH